MAACCSERDDTLDVSDGGLQINCGGDDTSRNYTAVDGVSIVFAIPVAIGITFSLSIAVAITVAIDVAFPITNSRLQDQRQSDGGRTASKRRQSHARRIA